MYLCITALERNQLHQYGRIRIFRLMQNFIDKNFSSIFYSTIAISIFPFWLLFLPITSQDLEEVLKITQRKSFVRKHFGSSLSNI